MQGDFLKVFNTYLVGINQANGFKTHNELTMYPLGNYPLAPSVYHYHDVSRYVAPFSAAPRPFNMHVTKIGLIGLDDLTKEDTRHTRGMWHHLLHHQRKGIAEVIGQIAFRSSRLA